MRVRLFSRFVAWLLAAGLLAACSSTVHRPYIAAAAEGGGCAKGTGTVQPGATTPEIVRGTAGYTLHFLEFDDQGWAYPNDPSRGVDYRPESQIDCAVAHLASRLGSGGKVRAFVFVHGWHHSAEDNDRNLADFRNLLASNATNSAREVIGFYIGWAGNTVNVDGVRHLTFWSRKNAAHHIAEGRVREFFSRVKALRDHWNQKKNSPGCADLPGVLPENDCPLRTVMIGHSFGALVLYAATSPYVLETLNSLADLPPSDTGDERNSPRQRGIADLILLINPAFEASRYEAVFRAAQRYHPERYESPLLVTITSVKDAATGTFFPLGRRINTLTKNAPASELESQAMHKTHGHIDHYLTHTLTVKNSGIHGERVPAQCDDQLLRAKFFNGARVDGDSMRLEPGWTRELCTGLQLQHGKNPGADPYNVVWNIKTFGEIIPNHSDINGPYMVEFVQQIYQDTSRSPMLRLVR